MNQDRPIRVLHVTLYLEIGGLETLIVEMCRRLSARAGLQTQVLCLERCDPSYKDVLARMGTAVTLLKRQGGLRKAFYLKDVARFMRSEHIDVVHSHSGCLFEATAAASLARVPAAVYTAHGMPFPRNLVTRAQDCLAAALVDRMLAVSSEIEASLTSRFPFATRKVAPVINGVDTDRFLPRDCLDGECGSADRMRAACGFAPGEIVIGSVGRLDPVKNYGCLVRAFSILARRVALPVRLAFVGEGDQREVLRELARAEGLEGQVTFLGTRLDVHRILPLYDVFVLSSLTEGTSVSLLEAQSCAVPAVVTDVGGNGHIIHDGVNGLLCRVNDPEDMAEKLQQLVVDRERAAQMGVRGRERVVKDFSLGAMVDTHERLYRELVKNVRGRSRL